MVIKIKFLRNIKWMFIIMLIDFKTDTNTTFFDALNETEEKVNCYDMVHFTKNNFYIYYYKI